MFTGKFLGAFLGFLLTHSPVGIMLGLLVGHVFDKGYRLNAAGWPLFQQRQLQDLFFKATFMVMGHVTKADGRVSEDEIRAARQIMRRMQLTHEQSLEAIRLFNLGKDANFNLYGVLDELRRECGQQRMLLELFLEIQFQAASVDGLQDANKRRVLTVICERLGFEPLFERFRTQRDRQGRAHHQRQRQQQSAGANPPTLAQDYRLLEVPHNASDAEVKKAYRRLMSKHHPDRLIAQGLPESMIKLANEKTSSIKAAYERIRHARGMR